MHRFYLPNAKAQGSCLVITGREAHHASSVVRLRAGDPATVLDGSGGVFTCRITEIGPKQLSLEIQHFTAHQPRLRAVTLIQALPKGGIFEDIIQKATELGVSRIIPLLTERVVTKLDADLGRRKAEKWRQVAIEAIKQSGNPWLPQIDEPMDVDAVLALNPIGELMLIGSLQPGTKHARQYFEGFQRQYSRKPNTVAVWVGPEGDFTAAEMQRVVDAGALPLTLGPLVLRVQTAAIYCLAIINHELSAPD